MDVRGASEAGLTPLLMDPYDDAARHDVERLRSLSDLLQMFR
jgi:hypothetical protein